MLCLCAGQLKFWLQTDLGRENSASCYRQAILFGQLSIDHIVAKTRLRHPFLPFDSLPYPTHTICRHVRTYARSITWQPNEKRLTIFHGYGALSHARFAHAGAPLKRSLSRLGFKKRYIELGRWSGRPTTDINIPYASGDKIWIEVVWYLSCHRFKGQDGVS